MPQANDKYKTSLDGLRDEIDAIDREITDLLLARCRIVAKVGKLKEDQEITGSYIRPRREAVMLRDLIGRFAGTRFPRGAVVAIWRAIIGASTAMESPLNLSVLTDGGDDTPHWLAREYFGAFLPSAMHTQASAVLADIARNQHTIGVVPLSPGSQSPCWWEELAETREDTRPIIFACLPFMASSGEPSLPLALAMGRVELMPSGDDHTLFVLPSPLPELPVTPAWTRDATSGRSVLVSIPGYHMGDAGLLKALGAQAVCIGAYATPYHEDKG